jgi:hypothetical protein
MDRRILETLSRDMDQSVPCTGGPIVLWGCALSSGGRATSSYWTSAWSAESGADLLPGQGPPRGRLVRTPDRPVPSGAVRRLRFRDPRVACRRARLLGSEVRGRRRRRRNAGGHGGACARTGGHLVPYGRQRGGDLPTKYHCCTDHEDRDQGQDEGVFDKSLSGLIRAATKARSRGFARWSGVHLSPDTGSTWFDPTRRGSSQRPE